MRNPVVVVDYDPAWPVQFARLRMRLEAALGELAAAIEHVGSTSVPGMAAKPIIDIDVLLAPERPLEEAVQLLAGLGYVHQGDLGIAGREAFRSPAEEPAHNLYVCLPGNREFRRHLMFRDYLRTHPEAAARYGALKIGLAARFRLDRDAYVEGKTEFVNSVLERAGWTETTTSADADPLRG